MASRINQEGFRIRVERDGDRVRLITRGGYDWTKRYPWIVEASLKNRIKRFVLGGEAFVPCIDGISDFKARVKRRRGVSSQAPLVGTTSPAAFGNW